jgi:tRNA(fMet)-specific endonuclease VapC
VPVSFDVDQSLCEHYAVQAARLKSAGTPIGGNDLWIACHALAQDATLVTNNMREFERITGLRLANWAA